MTSLLRQELDQLFAQTDEVLRECSQSQQRINKDTRDLELIYKTTDNAVIEPEPPYPFTQDQHDLLVEIVSQLLHQLRTEFNEAVAALRADATVDRSIVKRLKGSVRKRDGA